MGLFTKNNHSNGFRSSPNDKAKGKELSKSRTPSPPAYYRVFHVYYHGKPDHEAVFVETQEAGEESGHLYHVIGNTLNGMSYDHKQTKRPEESAAFHKRHQIGRVRLSDYAQLEAICRGIAVPGRQFDLRGKKLDNSKPLRRCGEWTADAIQELRSRGVLTA